MFKFLMTLLFFCSTILHAQSSSDFSDLSKQELQEFSDAQMKAFTAHRTLAFTSGGLLLCAGTIGTIHFLRMQELSHKYRDQIGFEEESSDLTPQINNIKQIWSRSDSQSLRRAHTTLIIASLMSYSATAAIELSWPNMNKSTSPWSTTKLHRNVFLLHASLMAINVGLGFAESYALSRGNHELVTGLGIAHIAVGFTVPVVMFSSGLIFKIPQ